MPGKGGHDAQFNFGRGHHGRFVYAVNRIYC